MADARGAGHALERCVQGAPGGYPPGPAALR